ncbi:TonB-dependent receptor [Algibacter amylolyticus]|uniref:TonB-dependent receptor n=1 Tax=Algibacter amylolyticus TaxID=1608400 RepID=A0A5M7BDR4_9FLAO|nr:TonB-dependent receptor [Algibacter amylolyticus]KAA5827776.1 TonB-dependent receptor [Algibacter amylolyticus]MBB5267003.1 TonB-linked SusC/RagA family outer membrane protein [Algibacter amylolyticus]TSJ82021.1 TonB-dependent receptor [Algibacter amylolyticus]
MKFKQLFFMPVFALMSLWVQAQVTGTVTSLEDGMPLPGVSVIVSGTTQGAATDFDGNYVLDNVDSNGTLVFSYVGYKTQEIQINGRSVINVVLTEDAASLDEIIVTGYARERKVDVTGAITVVELGPTEGASMSSGSAIQGLQGRVPGVYIEKSGDPTGASSNILIRGATTLGNNDPLFVIDGVPTVRQDVFSSINPSTIESVQVLKDASASSLYGARAGNGVIIVTTKNSARAAGGEKFKVSINSNISVLSEKKQRYDMLNAQQRGEILWQASVNDNSDPNGGYGQIYNFDWNGDFNNPILNGVTVQPFVGGDTSIPAGDTDWQNETYQTGYVYNNEISVSGGTDNSFHLLNVGHLRNTGILKYTGYERISAKLNSNFHLFDNRLRLGVNTQMFTSDETLASTDIGSAPTPGLAIGLAPTLPVYDANGGFAGPLGAGYSDRNNAVLIQYLNRWDNTDRTTVFGNIWGEFDIIENLTFRTSLGLDFSDYKRKDIEPIVRNGSVNRDNNRLILDTNKFTSLVFTNTLSYQLELNEKHKINVLLGVESIKDTFDEIYAQGDGFNTETEDYFVLKEATQGTISNGASTGSRMQSQFGKISYGFDDRYLASFTLRRDGSSRFGADNRYGVFPAATVGWRISNEEFWKDNDIVNSLKFRAGYGEVGNQTIGDVARFGLFSSKYGQNQLQATGDNFFFNTFYNVGTAYDLNGVNSGQLPSGFASVQAGNPALKWETTKEINLGLDFTLFNNNVVGSFDYFTRETSDILTIPPIASAIGEGQLRTLNGATTQVKGWELALGYSKTLDNGLSFTVATNFGAFKDEITELPAEVVSSFPGTVENSIIGHSQFSIYGYKYDGIFQNQAEVDASPTQVPAGRVGGQKFKDLSGNGSVGVEDRDFLGTTLPDLEYGIRIDMAYKDFDLSLFGSGVAGRIGQDPYIVTNNFVQGRDNGGVGVLNAWTPTNTNTDVPALTLANNDNRISDYLFRNNSYFKLRNLQFGYSLPEELANKLGGMTSCRVYFQGENLFWITPSDYIGSDPERTDTNRIPVPTTLSLGLNINF